MISFYIFLLLILNLIVTSRKTRQRSDLLYVVYGMGLWDVQLY